MESIFIDGTAAYGATFPAWAGNPSAPGNSDYAWNALGNYPLRINFLFIM